MSDSKLLELVGQILDASTARLDSACWPEICNLIADRYRGHVALFCFGQDNQETERGIFSERFQRCGDLLEHYYLETPLEEIQAHRRLASSASFELLTELDVFRAASDDDLAPMPFLDALHGRLGTSSRAGVRINESGPWTDAAAIYLPVPNEQFPEMVKRECELLFRVLGKAIGTSRFLASLLGEHGALLELFDRISVGTAFVGQGTKVVVANSMFWDMVSDGDAIRVVDHDRLTSRSGSYGVLESLCQPARASISPDGPALALLARRSGKSPLIVKASRIRVTEISPVPITLLVFIDPERRRNFDVSALEALGELRPAEGEVLGLLLEGISTEEIAQRRGTTVQTTRSQIKTVQARLGCRSRLELFHLSLTMIPPV